ncbi:MAG: nuclear transport factor 2 family protein [Asgard group archaeon]|nr:nuclear transport factor 2 family protein [Asgard group archaeon]
MIVDDKVILKELTEDYINILENCDEKKFRAIFHPKAVRFGLGNTNELMTMNIEEMIKYSLSGLKNLKKQITNPESITFTIKEIVDIKCLEGVIGSVLVNWQMKLPGSIGTHQTFIQFAKHENKWLIVNVLDKGFEKSE